MSRESAEEGSRTVDYTCDGGILSSMCERRGKGCFGGIVGKLITVVCIVLSGYHFAQELPSARHPVSCCASARRSSACCSACARQTSKASLNISLIRPENTGARHNSSTGDERTMST